MSRKLIGLLLSCWLGGALAARAQADFRPGYVIPLKGDTVRGLVDYRGAVRSLRLCRFRPAAEAAVVDYKPGEVRGYGFAGSKHYQSRLVQPTDSVQYQYSPPARPEFLEVLTAGTITLLRGRAADGVERYYVAPATRPATQPVIQLVPQRPQESDGVTRAHRTADLYRVTLTRLFADCLAARMRIASLTFTASALTAAVRQYNACQQPAGAAQPVVPVPSSSRATLYALLGAEASRLDFTGESFLAVGHYAGGIRPAGGLGVAIPLASFNEKLSAHAELLLEQQHYDDTFYSSSSGSRQRVQFRQLYIRLPLMLRYTLPTGRLRPFVQGGVTYARAVQSHTEVQPVTTSGGAIGAARPLSTYVQVINFEFGAVGSLGIHLPPIAGRPLTLEVRGEYSSGLVEGAGIDAPVRRLFVLAGYTFTK